MDTKHDNARLSRMATLWTVVRRAADDQAADAAEARNQLLLRYRGAVHRYLLAAVRDADVAGDLSQEFAVRFLRGDFRRADPGRGRFRDYLKSALVNLVRDHHRRRQAQPAPLAVDPKDMSPPPDSDPDFKGTWREELLELTWAALQSAQPVYCAILRLRVAEPDLPSTAMAERLSAELGRPLTAENVRKGLQRGHARFAELLLDQIADSLDDASAAELEAELRELDLLKYCRTALERRQTPRSAPAGSLE